MSDDECPLTYVSRRVRYDVIGEIVVSTVRFDDRMAELTGCRFETAMFFRDQDPTIMQAATRAEADRFHESACQVARHWRDAAE